MVGATAQIVLDGSPYWIVPNTYQHYTPRLRKATPRADGNEAYVDFGLGRRVCGQQYHDALYASYAKVNSVLVFVDVDNSSHNVRFDHLAARCPDVQTQVAGLGYHMEVELVEA